MPNDVWDDAIKEAYTLAPSNDVELITLEISHPLIDTIYLVRDRKDQVFSLEDGGGEKTFTACGFRMSLPPTGENGTQEMNLAIDNVDQVSDFVETVKASKDPVIITFRPYLLSDPSKPQMDPPLRLELRDVSMNDIEVTGKASFADIINKPFLTKLYTAEDFPGLSR